MIYQADQIRLWPRLLTQARSIDTVLAGALEDLMTRGASLDLRQDGGLQLGPGRMNEADYIQVRDTTLSPRRAKFTTIQAKVRTGSHPWSISVQQAYNDLKKRIESGTGALAAAAKARNAEAWARIITTLAERHLQAYSLSYALLCAEYTAYWQPASDHTAAYQDLWAEIRRAPMRIAYDDTQGRCWPIQTPDGWIWVIDIAGAVPKAVEGLHSPGEGEPVIPCWDLGIALAPIEGAQQREAG